MLIIFKSGNLNLTSYISSAECALHIDMWVKFWSNDRDRSLHFEALKELSISPGVLVYYTNHATLRKVWIVNKQRKTSGIYM